MWPHRRQPTKLLHPWDSPAKNTRVGCHFLLQCMKVKSESEVAQSCPTLHDHVDCSLPGSSVHGTLQARVLEWGAIAFSSRQRYEIIIQSSELHAWFFSFMRSHQILLATQWIKYDPSYSNEKNEAHRCEVTWLWKGRAGSLNLHLFGLKTVLFLLYYDLWMFFPVSNCLR